MATSDMPTSTGFKVLKILSWLSFFGLWITLALNGLKSPLVVQVITLAPLLIFLPGMIKQRHKTLSMLCFVCLIYFTAVTVNLFEPDAGILDALEMVWVVILFIATMLFSRSIQKHRYQMAMLAQENAATNPPSEDSHND
ncbi:DUF2069 domain-containing protein [Porticoccus sp. W117]|uniref:DUF2069 domain-containing protein n=1 Tax=Porticoccus sp. W117 TaxID=3054777 RepID=UPI002598C374|nr:DUF2069 domain-containing protein [Porticoccus sp. W117]MDM3870103.1 DUF2069 domain-containing protein [Porticoccus sp. W117]